MVSACHPNCQEAGWSEFKASLGDVIKPRLKNDFKTKSKMKNHKCFNVSAGKSSNSGFRFHYSLFHSNFRFFLISESQSHIARPPINQKRCWLCWGSRSTTAKRDLWENSKKVPLAFSHPLPLKLMQVPHPEDILQMPKGRSMLSSARTWTSRLW